MRIAVLEVTGGNVRNHHLYLREIAGFFPSDSIGGSNSAKAASPVKLWFGKSSIDTDIAGDKMIFRNRSAFRDFFEEEKINIGDFIAIERIDTREYRIWKSSKRAVSIYL